MIICNICKKPIEANEDVFFANREYMHTYCYNIDVHDYSVTPSSTIVSFNNTVVK